MDQDNYEIYYKGIYWNDYELVRREINRRITGNCDMGWIEFSYLFLKERMPFDKALILNCGNGWVDRELYQKGFFNSAIGADLSENLLNEARKNLRGEKIEYINYNIINLIYHDAILI